MRKLYHCGCLYYIMGMISHISRRYLEVTTYVTTPCWFNVTALLLAMNTRKSMFNMEVCRVHQALCKICEIHFETSVCRHILSVNVSLQQSSVCET